MELEISKLLSEKKFQQIIDLLNENLNYKKDTWICNILGYCFFQIQNKEEAIKNFKLSIFFDKNNPNPYFNLALIYSYSDIDKNLSNNLFLEAIKLDYKNADYRIAYANYLSKIDNDNALKYYNESIQLKPEKVESYIGLSQYYINKKKYEEATRICKEYFLNQYKHLGLLNNLCVALIKLGKFNEAITELNSALLLNGKMEELHLNLGICYFAKEKYSNSLDCFKNALNLNSKNEINLIFYARALLELNRPIESIKYLRAANKIKKKPEIFFYLGSVFSRYARINFALKLFKKSIKLDSNYVPSVCNYLFALRYKDNLNEDFYIEEAKKITAGVHCNKHTSSNLISELSKKIKIGFVSGDFNDHPVGRFLIGVLGYLKENFTLNAYCNNVKNDLLTTELKKKFNSWNNIYGLSDADASELIKNDKIDILFDLSGHTSHNRPIIFKLRSAPIQISWIGFLASTGIEEMDYLIADQYVVKDTQLKNFSEKIIRLPNIWNTYLYEERTDKFDSSPCIYSNYLTLGCFNNPNKINSETIKLYSEVLKSNKNIKIFFKYNNIGEAFIKNKIIYNFKKNLAPIENIFFEQGEKRDQFLKAYNKIDISIDPIGYNGGSSGFESIMMGVPVMSLTGETFLSRCGYSINMNLNLPKMIAKNKNEFIENINYFYENMLELDGIRKSLLTKGKFSNLFNHEKLSKNLTKELLLLLKK